MTQAQSIDDALEFRSSPGPSVGLEIELAVIDRETRELASGSRRILGACGDELIDNVAAELMQSMLEVRTGVHESTLELRRDLLSTLSRVRNVASSLGFDLALLGTHPSARPSSAALFPDPRYDDAEERMAWMIYHRVTFGMHVHVGVAGAEDAISLMRAMLPYVPHLVALSANSPFWQGVDTGLASVRAALYAMVPHAGLPGQFPNWGAFLEYYALMRACGALRSIRSIKWDIRPRPDLGTLEFRVCDTPASLDHAVGIAALIRALVVHTRGRLEGDPGSGRADVRDQWITTENKWLATRFGLSGAFIHPGAAARQTLADRVGALLAEIGPVARDLGDEGLLAPLDPIEDFESGASRQRRLYRQTGEWTAIVEDAVDALAERLHQHKEQTDV